MANIDATTPQLTVVKKWIDAHSALNLDHVELLMAKDFKFQTFPKSHKTPEERREHYIEKHKGMATAVTKAHNVVDEVVEAPGKVVVHMTGHCSTSDGATHTYDTTCFFSLTEEDGEIKILEIKDYVHTDVHSAFHAGMAKARGLV